MNRKKNGKLAVSALFAVFIFLVPVAVFASHFELSRLAKQLDLVSSQLAWELRYNGAYSSVRSRAQSLSREAGQLFDAIQRSRSNSSVRSHFKDVRRRYDKLEEAFLRANRKYYDAAVYREVELISHLFTGLSSEFYYAYNSVPRSRLPYYNSARSYSYSPFSSRSYSPPSRSSRAYSPRSRSPAYSVPQAQNRRQQAIPQVFRGDGDRADSNRNRSQRPPDRQDNPRRAQPPRDNFDQPSPVLDRQRQQNRDRRQTGNRVRNTQTSDRVQVQGAGRPARAADKPRRVENQGSNRRDAVRDNRRGIDNSGNRSRRGPARDLH